MRICRLFFFFDISWSIVDLFDVDFLKTFAKENNYKYFETSAKTGEGVDEAIRELVTLVLNQNGEIDEQKIEARKSVQIKNDVNDISEEKKKGCC